MAVNIQQRELIQEELNRLIVDDVLVDQYREKVLSKGEELFVKNLENVQGDERDFIFVSMTYGPEVGTSVLKQRFGPINRKQGHRRLNVLFSRARTRIGLFCSFGSADVVPTPESSEGVHVLRKYLEYAETRGLVSVLSGFGADADSDFRDREVADRLRARGATSSTTRLGFPGTRSTWVSAIRITPSAILLELNAMAQPTTAARVRVIVTA